MFGTTNLDIEVLKWRPNAGRSPDALCLSFLPLEHERAGQVEAQPRGRRNSFSVFPRTLLKVVLNTLLRPRREQLNL